jgi:arylsulfatase A-like enzyme
MRNWTLVFACALSATSCQSEIELVEHAAEDRKSEQIVLGGETKRAVLSPLSAEIAFRLELPQDSELSFSPALLTTRRVARARVDFRVGVSSEGRDIEVYRRELRAGQENEWHQARVDLGAWSGKAVTLTLRTEPSSGAAAVPWASRVRPVWGEPSIRTRPTSPLGEDERPSFIVLIVDTLRADYLGTYGFEGQISPNLDRLAAESVLFENCFANAPWTKPSIATLFTSLPPAVHGVTTMGKPGWAGSGRLTQVLPEEAETLAERLQGAGYRTAAFVANPFVSPRHGFAQGFELFRRSGGSEDLLPSAREWLASDRNAPFFLYLHVMDVHAPYKAARPDFEAVLRQIDRGDSRTLTEEDLAQIPEYMRGVAFASEEERLRLESWRAAYGGGVRTFDRRVGGFLDALRANGVLDRAYFVLASDHGEELLEHGGWNHGNNLYDHQLHVPLLIRTPLAGEAGRRVSSLVSLIDLMPTLLALAGVEAPPGILGHDFAAALRGEGLPETRAVFATSVNGNPRASGVRTPSHKLIWDETRGELQLFDLAVDPAECRDLSSEDAAFVARLKSYLLEHRARNAARGALAPESVLIESEHQEELEALGYVLEK